MADKFQLKGTLAATWASVNPVLSEREPGVETDTGKMKIGDGLTAWNDLSYQNMDAVEHRWINDTELQFSNPDGSWGTAVDLGENAASVSTVDNGDGTINITFTFDRGGAHTITTPAINGRVVAVTKVNNPDGSIDLTFENSNGSLFTITTPVLGNNADTLDGYDADLVAATIPQHYSRSQRWRGKSNTARTTITTPDKVLVNIEGSGYKYAGPTDINLDTTTMWDDTQYQTPANRAGKDFYIYACVPSAGQTFDIVLSANSTIPSGYTAATSRKIGGFHCLCTAIGTSTYAYVNSGDDISLVDEAYVSHTISGTKHWLYGYIAGDVLPFSLWDLIHRPSSNPEGMVYDPGTDTWVDIYLASWDGSHLVTANGGTIADGGSSPAFHQYKFSQLFGRQKKMLPRQDDFVSFSLGSPQGVNISGSADPGTAGGHLATDGKRIVSLIGVEDATGVLWQWGREAGATNDVGAAYANAYDANDINVAGQHYEAPNRPLFGGNWGTGALCGSRGSYWSYPALRLNATIGGRGVAEPLGRRS
jgi:hypothetical protein